MLIEPTESETLEEVDRYVMISCSTQINNLLLRFCDAMIQIRREVEDVITGRQPKDNNVLKNAPHPPSVIALSDKEWNR
jgi:glycine dehydrogenase